MTLDIPSDLINSLNMGQLTLFVGHDIDLEISGLPKMANLAGKLAHQTQAWRGCPLCSNSQGCTRDQECILPFRQAATVYEQALGTNSLIGFLKHELTIPFQPTPTIQAITDLPVRTVITTAYDERLEDAYRAAGISFQQIADDSQVVTDETRQLQIIHLYGVLSRPESLVLTEADYASAFVRKPLIGILLQFYLTTNACLFVSVDFNDPYLQTLYSKIVKELGRHRRWPYVLEFPPMRPALLPVKSLSAAPTELLRELVKTTCRRTDYQRPLPKPKVPYKFLDPYEAEDRAVFFGREIEASELTHRIGAHKLTLLFAYSGRGKSSLLRAGVVPNLEREGLNAESIRLGADPSGTLEAAVERLSTVVDPVATEHEARPTGVQVLIVDQAEELFTVCPPDTYKSFVDTLISCLSSDKVDLHILLSLRIEYVGQLEALFASQGHRDILSNRLSLDGLGPAQARLAIRKPAELFGVQFEDELIDVLLTHLETTGYDPSQLSILSSLLYEYHARLPGEEKAGKIGMTEYEHMGRAAGILERFVDNALARLDDAKIQADAKSVMKNMVTIQRTKLALTFDELTKRLSYTGLSESDIKRTLSALQDQRLVRSLEDSRYELAHDVLVSKIWTWMDTTDIARLNAAEILREAMSHFGLYGHLMSEDKQLAVEQAAGGLELDATELALLLMSAVATDRRQRALIWIARIEADSGSHSAVLEVLQSAQPTLVDAYDAALRAEVLIRHRDLAPYLLQAIIDGFGWSELQDLCLRLDVDFEQILAETRSDKASLLTRSFEEQGQLDVLIAEVAAMNPNQIYAPHRPFERLHLDPPTPSRASVLCDLLTDNFNNIDLHEVDQLCAYLRLKPDELAIEGGKRDKVRRLAIIMARQSRLDDLALAMARFKPRLVDLVVELKRIMTLRYDMDRIRVLCFDLGLDYDDLHSSSKQVMVDDLVGMMARHGRISDLVDAVIFPDQVGADRPEVLLRRRLSEKMSAEDLRTLCFDLTVNWDDLPGNSTHIKSVELIRFMERRGRLSMFVLYIIVAYPHVLSGQEIWDTGQTATKMQGQMMSALHALFMDPPSYEGVGLLADRDDRTRTVMLRRILADNFSADEFQEICYTLGIDYYDLAGRALSDKRRELILHLDQANRLQELMAIIGQHRPYLRGLLEEREPHEPS